MSSSKEIKGADATQDMLDKLIKKISKMNVELIRNRQVISKLKKDKESQLQLLRGLQRELGILEDVIATKNQVLETYKKEGESLKGRPVLTEIQTKDKELLISNFKEKTSALEAELMELENVIGNSGSKIEMDSLETCDEEQEIIEDIRTRIDALRGVD